MCEKIKYPTDFLVLGSPQDDFCPIIFGRPFLNTDTSILHHAFISIFIALWVVITRYVTILMPSLSYFTRFT